MTNRTRRLAVAATLLVALLVPAGAASAKGNGNGNGSGNGRATAPGQVRSGEARSGDVRGGEPGDDQADDDADTADEGTEDSQGGRPAVPPGQAKKAEAPDQGRGSRPEGTPASGALPPGWARAAERAATRPATLTGVVASASAGSITVTVKGGHPLFRLWALQNGTAGAAGTITVTLAPEAVVKLDDQVATLADLTAGDHVSIRGTFADGTLTAVRVNASTPDTTGAEPD